MRALVAGVCALAIAVAAQAQPAPRTADGHPDLSGTWKRPFYSFNVQKTAGSVFIQIPQGTGQRVPGAPRNEPAYRPEYAAKVKALGERQDFEDKVFYCGRPGVPRLGAPAKIVQTPGEVVLLYQHYPTGDYVRVVSTDGRPHRDDLEPTYNGDSVGRWEGDVLVIESVNFVTDTWTGEDGYIHSDKLKVIERLWREGATLRYQATVEDPEMLLRPWIMAAQTLSPSDQPFDETPPCMDVSGPLLDSTDHH